MAEVTVDANSIKDIKLITFEQTDKGKQGEAAARAKAEIPAAIMAKQSLAIDSVAKASASSVGIELAVAQALEQATVAYKDGKYTGKSKGYDNPKHPGEIEVNNVSGRPPGDGLPDFAGETVLMMLDLANNPCPR